MKIYISGISGTGMGPLALMAKTAGLKVSGSDTQRGAVYTELIQEGIKVKIGKQDGKFLKQKLAEGVDWFVYTSALSPDHAELKIAREAGVKCTKRDDLTAYLVDKLGLKMVAVAGTHGKTTTASMIIYTALRLGLPVSHIVGTTLGFAPSGAYHEGDRFFVYEADEYDRNFLKFRPWLAVIPAVSYDHSDIYPTREDYENAFRQFEGQSERVIKRTARGVEWKNIDNPVVFRPQDFKLAGAVRREDAALAGSAVAEMVNHNDTWVDEELDNNGEEVFIKLGEDKSALEEKRGENIDEIVDILREFPGVGRRFERIGEGFYSDYAHHPEEIKATIDVARDEADLKGYLGVVVVYEPHQNTRQHQVRAGYKDAFSRANKIYWLPTFLTREDESLPVLTQEELISGLSNSELAEAAKLDGYLLDCLMMWRSAGLLVLLLSAGPADRWLRGKLAVTGEM